MGDSISFQGKTFYFGFTIMLAFLCYDALKQLLISFQINYFFCASTKFLNFTWSKTRGTLRRQVPLGRGVTSANESLHNSQVSRGSFLPWGWRGGTRDLRSEYLCSQDILTYLRGAWNLILQSHRTASVISSNCSLRAAQGFRSS